MKAVVAQCAEGQERERLQLASLVYASGGGLAEPQKVFDSASFVSGCAQWCSSGSGRAGRWPPTRRCLRRLKDVLDAFQRTRPRALFFDSILAGGERLVSWRAGDGCSVVWGGRSSSCETGMTWPSFLRARRRRIEVMREERQRYFEAELTPR